MRNRGGQLSTDVQRGWRWELCGRSSHLWSARRSSLGSAWASLKCRFFLWPVVPPSRWGSGSLSCTLKERKRRGRFTTRFTNDISGVSFRRGWEAFTEATLNSPTVTLVLIHHCFPTQTASYRLEIFIYFLNKTNYPIKHKWLKNWGVEIYTTWEALTFSVHIVAFSILNVKGSCVATCIMTIIIHMILISLTWWREATWYYKKMWVSCQSQVLSVRTSDN